MKIKKLLALLLVVGMVVSITPVGTFAENLIGEGTETSGPVSPGGEGEGTDTPGTGEGTAPTTPGTGEGTDPTTPGTGEGTDPTTPGTGEGTDPTTPGTGEGTDPTTPGTGEGTGPATPGTGEGTDPTTPGTGEGTGPANPGTGEGTDPTNPGTGEGTDPTTPGEVEEVVPPVEELPQELPQVAEFEALMERLSVLETAAEFWAALQALTEDEWALLEQGLDADIYDKIQAIAQLDAPPPEESTETFYVTEGEDEDAPVPFTDAAPLLPPRFRSRPNGERLADEHHGQDCHCSGRGGSGTEQGCPGGGGSLQNHPGCLCDRRI